MAESELAEDSVGFAPTLAEAWIEALTKNADFPSARRGSHPGKNLSNQLKKHDTELPLHGYLHPCNPLRMQYVGDP